MSSIWQFGLANQYKNKKAPPGQCRNGAFAIQQPTNQDMCCPPLIAIFAPVTKAASSDDR